MQTDDDVTGDDLSRLFGQPIATFLIEALATPLKRTLFRYSARRVANKTLPVFCYCFFSTAGEGKAQNEPVLAAVRGSAA